MDNNENKDLEDAKPAEDQKSMDDKSSAEKEMINKSDDSGYTPEENQFADGKGTQLDEEIDEDKD